VTLSSQYQVWWVKLHFTRKLNCLSNQKTQLWTGKVLILQFCE
jgi:hypothetical protein